MPGYFVAGLHYLGWRLQVLLPITVVFKGSLGAVPISLTYLALEKKALSLYDLGL